MPNIKLILEYDGTNYHGWQSQAGSGRQTIQDTLELAIRELTGQQIRTVSSGRTDAGVHALGHVANFKTSSAIPAKAWAPALNRLLPEDIRIIASEAVSESFHARYSALGKTYLYRILNRAEPSALFRNRAWHVNRPLDVLHMKRAAAVLRGRHDFSAFRSAGCGAKSTVRDLRHLSVITREPFLDIVLQADAFLQHMARNIAGTLVEAGLGRFTADEVKGILASHNRLRAGKTAPARGLYLLKVEYPADPSE